MSDVSRETLPSSSLMDEASRATQYKMDGLDKLPPCKSTRIFSIANQKGGVGKTTTAVNVAYCLAQQGLHVLIIDLDPQANATTALNIDKTILKKTSYHLLTGELDYEDIIVHHNNPTLHIIPTDINLSGAEIELVQEPDREKVLSQALHNIQSNHHYDYIIIDSPPSLGLLTINSIAASNNILIPIQCEYYALEGVSQLLKSIQLLHHHLQLSPSPIHILLTMYDGRTKLSEQVFNEVKNYFPSDLLNTKIPRSIRLAEAPSYGMSILEYDPGSTGAKAYIGASQEIYSRGK